MKRLYISMNMKKGLLPALAVIFLLASCEKDLDRKPYYEVTSASVYADFNNYISVLAKCYAGFALTGLTTGDGNSDVSGADAGYLREYWQMQELTTDEAVIAWNDADLLPMHPMSWTSNNGLLRSMYNRIYYEVSLCNEFLRETTDGKLSSNGITGDNAEKTKKYRAEVRFLRALAYAHAIDMFGNVPFVTEEDPVGAFFPKQISRKDLFDYVESELKAIEPDLTDPMQNEYGRADKAAAWALLARLYLNAEVYTGTSRYDDAITYCNKVIAAGYTLEPQYKNLFLADNDKSKEIIFPIVFDGMKMQTYNATTFLVHTPVGGTMNPADFGINGGWYGLRTTKAFVSLFDGADEKNDKRNMFYTDGQNLEINDISNFADGYPIAKWKNITSSGAAGSDPGGMFVDTDYPMFRLAEIYLTYAEAVLRGGKGDMLTALLYINKLRERAYGSLLGDILPTQLTLDFVLDERGRELQWEAHRRTDLIRFGKFTDNYTWPWKGGVKDGKSVEAYRTLFPLPVSDITANPNLKQNDGY